MKSADENDLPLFDWRPPIELLLFPLNRRVGRVRDVAGKLITKETERHARYYVVQVSHALESDMRALGLAENERQSQLSRFWREVDCELARLRAGNRTPKGAA